MLCSIFVAHFLILWVDSKSHEVGRKIGSLILAAVDSSSMDY